MSRGVTAPGTLVPQYIELKIADSIRLQ
jgi:hypothetical protein